MKHSILYSLLFVFIISFSTSAGAIVRECSYKIYVASDKEGISSTILPNGTLISKGRHKGSSKDKKYARHQAAIAAKRCLDTAFAGNTIPKYCKPRDWESTKDGYVSLYNILKLKTVAFNAACNEARKLDIKNDNLEGISIFAVNVKDIDAKSECNMKDAKDNFYYNVAKGLATNCAQDISSGQIATGANLYTGWYDENAKQIKSRIKKWCKKTYNRNSYKISHYEIKSKSGKVRAKYSCK